MTQIGVNVVTTTKGKARYQALSLTLGLDLAWTLAILLIEFICNHLLLRLVVFLNHFLCDVLAFVPSWMVTWIVLPLVIAYIVFAIEDIVIYLKKKHQYMTWKRATLKKEEQKLPTLSAENHHTLDEMSKHHHVPTAMLFRKVVRAAFKNPTELYVVKKADNYWIPLVNEHQWHEVKKYAADLASKLTEPTYPCIVKVAPHQVDVFNKADGQQNFKNDIDNEGD